MHTIFAVDDGFVHGKLGFADLMFLIAAILAAIGAIIAFQVKTLYATLIAAALCFGFIGFFVL